MTTESSTPIRARGHTVKKREDGTAARHEGNKRAAADFNRQLAASGGAKTIERPTHFNGKRARSLRAFIKSRRK